jgi:4-hydroxy-tetrahydrodipicolinate synthase
MMAVGGSGVISVASNIVPADVRDMVHHALEGRWTEAQALHHRYHELFGHLLQLDTNPVPVKTALALMHRVEETFRLPMCPMAESGRAVLRAALAGLGLVEEGR